MKICLSPYRKYLLSTVIATPFLFLIVFIIHPFVAFVIGIGLVLYSTSIRCPKCKQAIACNKDGHCFLPFDMSALNGVVWHHCKQCEYDLSRCEKDEEK